MASFIFTAAVVVPIVTAEPLVGTPALQLVEVFQLLSPAVPVHESAVRAGELLWVRTLAAAAPLKAAGLRRALRLATGVPCAVAGPTKLTIVTRRQRAVLAVSKRDQTERMADSWREIFVPTEPVRGTMSTAKSQLVAVGPALYGIPR